MLRRPASQTCLAPPEVAVMGRPSFQTFVLADRETWGKPHRTVDGIPVELVAIQYPLPGRKHKHTFYCYQIGDRPILYRNHNPAQVYYRPTGATPQTRRLYFETFIKRPLTPGEQTWLTRNRYVLQGRFA